MRRAVEDLVLRMLQCGDGEAARVAAICSSAAEATLAGDVAMRIASPEERALLVSSGAVVSIAPDDSRPFVLAGDLLYTRRNWRYERTVERVIMRMASESDVAVDGSAALDGLSDEQREAALSCACSRFAILTGGPGTGKTHTIARAVRIARERQPRLRIGFAAPTGKAAARMGEALAAAGEVARPTTLARLLGARHDLASFRHDSANPLALDWLIVDEASMIDLPLMAHLVSALPASARLTLVGDERQLASVERGRVLADLVESGFANVARLSMSRRFVEGGAISRFAEAVNVGDFGAAMARLRESGDCLAFSRLSGGDIGELVTVAAEGWSAFAAEKEPERAIRALGDFRVVCALRRGAYGVERVNAALVKRLGGSIHSPRCPLPLMVTRNDPSLGLANGDVGVVMPDAPSIIWFPGASAARSVRRELVDDAEVAFATTVHKAQGSEFTSIAVSLGVDSSSAALTREMLYTAITRTRGKVRLFASEEAIAKCCHTRVERTSGMFASVRLNG